MVPAAIVKPRPCVSRFDELTYEPLLTTGGPLNVEPVGNKRLSNDPGVASPVIESVTVPFVTEPLIVSIVSLPVLVVTVRVPLPVQTKPPKAAAGPVRVQSYVTVSALAGSMGAANGKKPAINNAAVFRHFIMGLLSYAAFD
jgi:hypothetical protein